MILLIDLFAFFAGFVFVVVLVIVVIVVGEVVAAAAAEFVVHVEEEMVNLLEKTMTTLVMLLRHRTQDFV